jgi:anti-sigma-K factor RskA
MIRAFEGCACKPGQCKSAAVPLQSFTARAQAQTKASRTVMAKQNAWRALLFAAAVFSIAVFAGVTAHTLMKIERQHELQARI